MYIRTIRRKNKDGSITGYVQLAHNYRDPKSGQPRAKVLYTFGREDELDLDALRRLAQSIHRFVGDEFAAGRGQSESVQTTLLDSRPMGGAYLLDQLWRKLGLDEAIRTHLSGRKFRTGIERIVFAMVANRALNPSSKLAIEEWVEREVAIPEVDSFDVQQGYRAMDFLLEAADDLQFEVYRRVSDLLNLDVDLLFFDTTSTYFETEQESEEGIRRKGYSKDHRPDAPQVVIGLAVTREGIPVRCWTWPGNTADMSVVEEVKRDLVGWRLGRVVTVVDRGFASEENLRTLQRAGGHYIAGEKMNSGKDTVDTALAHPGRFRTLRPNLKIKEVIVGDGEARVRYVLAFNPEEAKRDAARRELQLLALREELSRLKELKGDAHTKAHCRLMSHPGYKRYLKQDKWGNLRIDPAAVREAAHLDGKYLIRTSDDTLPTDDVALGYKQLLTVESAFRTLKHTLDLRPVYHRKDERIRAHVLLCWLALLLVRIAENRTGRTWPDIRSHMQTMHRVTQKTPQGIVVQRTETTEVQREILGALQVAEPPRVLGIRMNTPLGL
ncbi:IS1634 family transposase [Alicyclobacillus macrosporangiidus]|uniref:IS1634 family transposase n=1 Tax=Alicyclobacillus macrosporangiidus TaxID=392015 RepID=UPI00049694D0|nr:IS1634 family transposase [Alicyclobacillus macrosporangiidus]